MLTSYDVIKTMLRTEKGTMLEPLGKYFFQVGRKSNKVQIKKAIEEIYKVKVDSVNIVKMPHKRKRVRQEEGITAAWKKAIVTLKEGNKIETT